MQKVSLLFENRLLYPTHSNKSMNNCWWGTGRHSMFAEVGSGWRLQLKSRRPRTNCNSCQPSESGASPNRTKRKPVPWAASWNWCCKRARLGVVLSGVVLSGCEWGKSTSVALVGVIPLGWAYSSVLSPYLECYQLRLSPWYFLFAFWRPFNCHRRTWLSHL